jgi:hypothetical protein
MSRYVIGALSALGSFDRPRRSDDEEADGKGHGGKQNSNKEEIVGKRMHADLQSAAPRAINVPPYRIGVPKKWRYSVDSEKTGVRSAGFFPTCREKSRGDAFDA